MPSPGVTPPVRWPGKLRAVRADVRFSTSRMARCSLGGVGAPRGRYGQRADRRIGLIPQDNDEGLPCPETGSLARGHLRNNADSNVASGGLIGGRLAVMINDGFTIEGVEIVARHFALIDMDRMVFSSPGDQAYRGGRRPAADRGCDRFHHLSVWSG